MKIATTIGELYNVVPSPAEAVRAYKGTGFKHLDYSFYYAHVEENSPYMQDDDRAWKKEVEDAIIAAEECGLTFVQAHTPGYNPGAPGDYEKCVRAMQRSVEACSMLGIPVTVMHTSFSKEYKYPSDRDGYFKYNKKFVGAILDTAEKFNVTVCIENTSNGNAGQCYFPRTAAEMNDFISYMNHPLLGACWDTGHAVMDGKFDQYADLKELGGNLKAVHIHDNGVHSDQHLAPYCGKLQLDSIVKGLIDIDYKGAFTFESDSFLNHCNGNGPLQKLPLEIRQDGFRLLYKIGKFVLESYNISID